ncbi:MAG: rhomboid family intramembrane serine protease [Bacteroidia bacterium]|nr:rhomboid family intramembrane serine protease [Bacteroidia bacterium]
MRIGQNTNIPPVIKNLLIINVIMFAATWLVFNKYKVELSDYLGLHYIFNPSFKPWQIITHMFMHGSLTHIAFNMFGLFIFGSFLENMMGPKKFISLYFVSGIGAAAVHLGVLMLKAYLILGTLNIPLQGDYSASDAVALSDVYFSNAVGASGAIYGIMVAFAYLFPNTEMYFMFIPFPVKAKYLIPLILLSDVVLGLVNAGDNVAHFAHIGGGIAGFIFIYITNKRDRSGFY